MKYPLLHKRTALLSLTLFSGILLLWCGSAWAITIENPLQAKDFPDLLERILKAVIPLAITVGVITIIWEGFLMILAAARGDSGGVGKARTMLLHIVVGIVLVAAATAIAGALQSFIAGL